MINVPGVISVTTLRAVALMRTDGDFASNGMFSILKNAV
jgi:hypothetical protein